MMMCHLLADSLDELHAMADAIGADRKWFQNKGSGLPHYDICKSKRELAIKAGAIEIDNHGVLKVIRQFRKENI